MRFDYYSPTRIILGEGVLEEAGPIAHTLGRRALVVTGRDVGRAAPLMTQLQRAQVEPVLFSVSGEPTTTLVTSGVDAARKAGCDFVIGFGGGSAIDAAKAIAALLANPGELNDYLEVIGRGLPLVRDCAPVMAIPTTAGTGAEVTRNAVLASPEHKVKVSIRSPSMVARVALIDPCLTMGLPPRITATTGLDTLTQLIEPFVSIRANPMTDALCREGMIRAARSLRQVYTHGGDLVARLDMSVASLMSGLALANAGLGAVHGFAGPIGGMFDAPHGAVCAALLPQVMETNIAALRQRAPEGLRRYEEVARILTSDPGASPEAGARWVRTLVRALDIPGLGAFGIGAEDFPVLIRKARQASSMKGNPIVLTDEELTGILKCS